MGTGPALQWVCYIHILSWQHCQSPPSKRLATTSVDDPRDLPVPVPQMEHAGGTWGLCYLNSWVCSQKHNPRFPPCLISGTDHWFLLKETFRGVGRWNTCSMRAGREETSTGRLGRELMLTLVPSISASVSRLEA